jgi:hypothetical protein
MGAARFAAVQALRDPIMKQYLIDHHAYQKQIQDLKDKSASELEELRRQLTSQLVTMNRQLTSSRVEVEALKSANTHLQCRVQEQDAELKKLKIENVDLQQHFRACGNITKFLAEIARGEMRGEQ